MVSPLLPWIILFAPFFATALIVLFALKSHRTASFLSLSGILISLAATITALCQTWHQPHALPIETSYTWIRFAGLQIDFGFLIDPLSLLMLLVVTGVGSCIFFYSVGYMKGDASFPRFFAYLSLFAFSMIGIVLANNFLMLFIFWELVAVSSYLLIGFWYEKPAAADAGNKAFIVNRMADFGLMLGIIYVWMLSGDGGQERTFIFSELGRRIPDGLASHTITQGAALIAALLVFCGVAGKSAQFPLYIWLPDAMEGPTPVSALIHAATMVAAGVYLLTRTFFLVQGIDQALIVIASIGAVTAVLAAILAVVQDDIKKILAYSTISQLGYMVMALGLGSSVAAMYHLTTHAFFKALLFLSAGAMIHALHTQDIWHMGGLLKRLPVTATTFLIGTLALCGIFPFSGFFSKDEILTQAYNQNTFIFAAGLFAAMLTAFYMTRTVWIAILAPKRAQKHDHGSHAIHEAPLVMRWPLIVLAILACVAGFIGIPQFLMGSHAHQEPINLVVAVSSTLVALVGIALGTWLYAGLKSKEDPLKNHLKPLFNFVVHKYYLDEVFSGVARFFSDFTAKVLLWFDLKVVISKGVDGVSFVTNRLANSLRKIQTGDLQTYSLLFGAGVISFIFFVLRVAKG